ncbi:MAG: hypothetical protein RR177_05955 [Oscillospiraceae bacterium]
MDDMASKLSELLSDPQAVDKIRSMADSLFAPQNESDEASSSSSFKLPENFDMGAIMNIMGALNSAGSDPRAELLRALKPHLSSERSAKIDTAI